jgi:hypothetical protein
MTGRITSDILTETIPSFPPYRPKKIAEKAGRAERIREGSIQKKLTETLPYFPPYRPKKIAEKAGRAERIREGSIQKNLPKPYRTSRLTGQKK